MSEKVQKKFEEVTLYTDPVFQGKFISLQVDTVKLPNGDTATREIVKHPGAVAVLAVKDNKMIVVEQYRKPIEKSLIEVPAGKLEQDEEPLAAARRELEEETGYYCENLSYLCSFYTAPGFSDEIIHLYAADHLEKGQANPDEGEFLECTSITLEEAQKMIAEGRIADAKTMMAVYIWQITRMNGRA
jgi:ADP-ribose pyrophosphatase